MKNVERLLQAMDDAMLALSKERDRLMRHRFNERAEILDESARELGRFADLLERVNLGEPTTAADADLLATLERIAQIGGNVDVRA